ncbi:hypothetical protein B7463_g5595, partial [Scytalidium lignicola]
MTTTETMVRAIAPPSTTNPPTHDPENLKWSSLFKRHIELMDAHVKFMRAEMSTLDKEEQMRWESGEREHWKSLCGMIERARIGREDANSSYKFVTSNKVRKHAKLKVKRVDDVVKSIKSAALGVEGKLLNGIKSSPDSMPITLKRTAALAAETRSNSVEDDHFMEDTLIADPEAGKDSGRESKALNMEPKKMRIRETTENMEASTDNLEEEKRSKKRRASDDEEPIDEKRVKKVKKQKRVKGLAKQSEEVARIVEARLKEEAKRAAEEEEEAAVRKRQEKKRKRRDSQGSSEDPESTPKKKHKADPEKRKSIGDIPDHGRSKKRKMARS